MKILIATTISTTLFLYMGAFGQKSISAEPVKDNFKEMTFEVTLGRDRYYLWEPVLVTFKLSNKTKSEARLYHPSFLRDSRMKVLFMGQNYRYDLSPTINSGGVRLPSVVPVGWSSTDNSLLGPAFTGNLFPEPGKYYLQFELRNWNTSDKTISSNLIEITIAIPDGTDGKALSFILEHYSYFGLSSWQFHDDEGRRLLEQFVDAFGTSVYGEHAVMSLAYLYLARRELKKAQMEFEKLASSKNSNLVDEAKRNLAEIERKLKVANP